LGHYVLTMPEAGEAGKALPDEVVLAQATAAGRAVLTPNRRHFVRLHASHPSHAGIVVCSFDADFPGQARRIHDAIVSEPTLAGRIVRVNRPLSLASPVR
jgi:hypothetical protein